MTPNELIGFGGVLFLGLVGFIVGWILMPRKDDKVKK